MYILFAGMFVKGTKDQDVQVRVFGLVHTFLAPLTEDDRMLRRSESAIIRNSDRSDKEIASFLVMSPTIPCGE